MRPIEEIKEELKGTQICNFLQSEYQAKLRESAGSHYIYDVIKGNRCYTVRFQFVRLSIFNYPNQYRNVTCNCMRFAGLGNCHHQLIACQAHAESIGETLSAETFVQFQLSKANQSKMNRRAN